MWNIAWIYRTEGSQGNSLWRYDSNWTVQWQILMAFFCVAVLWKFGFLKKKDFFFACWSTNEWKNLPWNLLTDELGCFPTSADWRMSRLFIQPLRAWAPGATAASLWVAECSLACLSVCLPASPSEAKPQKRRPFTFSPSRSHSREPLGYSWLYSAPFLRLMRRCAR
jgi:hypothetical protein